MPEPTAALAALRVSTANLVQSLDEEQWTDTAVAAPSLLPSWTRGHVLTHLARNADGVARTLSGALGGEIVARYRDGRDGRARDIEAGARRGFAALRTDVTESAARLDRVLDAVTKADAWDNRTDAHWPSTVNQPASYWVFVRLREIEIHRVDLGTDYRPDQWPALLVSTLLPEVADTLDERAPVAVRVSVTADGSLVPDLAASTWTAGPAGSAGSAGAREPSTHVSGPDWAVLAWLLGRGSLIANVLGPVPTLFPWR